MIDVWGAERVGIRISPLSPTNGMSDADPHDTFAHAAEALEAIGIAYLHVIEPGVNGTLSEAASATSPDLGSGYFRALFSGPIIAAGGHDARTGAARIAKGDADLVAYGKLYIANPDLPGALRMRGASKHSRPSDFLRRRRTRIYQLPDPVQRGPARDRKKGGMPPPRPGRE